MDSAPLFVLVLLLGFALVASCQAPTGWQPAQCVPADVPMQELYDVAQVVDDFEAGEQAWQTFQGEQNATNTIALDESQGHGGSASLRVDYEFAGNRDLEYIQLSPNFPIPEPGYSVGYWLKTDGARFLPRLRVSDASGETHQFDMVAGKEPGWWFVVADLSAPSSFWGGDGNGKLDYPLTFNGILFDRPSREWAGQGSLWIDEVTLGTRHPVTQTLQVDVENKRFGNLYTLTEPVALRASGLGERLSWSVKDYFGVEIASGEGPAAQVRADFSLPKPGYYECRFTLSQDGRQTEQVVFPMAALTGEARPASSDFVGVNCHFGQNAYPLECMDLLVRYGVSRFRDECGWGGVETVKGQYALPPHCQAYYAKAKEVGLKPLTILDYSNGLYDEGGFPNSEEAIAGFANYGRALAQLTEGTVDNFEVWNEWIGGCGMGGRPGDHGPEAYGKLLKTTYETIKGEFPDVTVVGIGGEYGADCAENVSKMVDTSGPDSMDAWSIHPYRYPRSPEYSDLVGDVGRIRDAVVSRGAPERVWITEIGYPTHRGPSGTEEEDQAPLVVRTLALLQATRGVERCYWYDLKDDGLERTYNEHNFGLIHHQNYNCAPKPAMVAVSAYSRLTAGATSATLTQSDDAYTITYALPDGRQLLMVWTTGPERPLDLRLPIEQAFDLMGAPLELSDQAQLSQKPIYLLLKGED